MTDDQAILDNETKAKRYDRIVRCQALVEELREQVALLGAKLKQAKRDLKEAGWNLNLAMSPVRKGVRG